jgi:Flp pilus assembly protein TadD
MKELNKSLELDPKFPNASFNLGLAYYTKADYNMAVTYFKQAISTTVCF